MSDQRWYEATMSDREREIAHRARIDRALGAVSMVFAAVVTVAMMWIYLSATPSQRSAECDLCAEQLDRTGVR